VVAKANKGELERNWQLTQKVLLNDISSGEYITIEYALYTFIALGEKEIIPVLIKKLDKEGTVIMAEAYLNCGNRAVVRKNSCSRGFQLIFMM
jgi:hypothetical protein